jgi:DNA-binding NarL/FixJ family response regulator
MMNIGVALVDDNPVYRHALVELLKSHGAFDIAVAAAAFPELLDGVVDEEPDLILIDESVFWDLTEEKRRGFLKYFADIPMLVMGLDPPAGLECYSVIHPRIRFLGKESGGLQLVQRLLEMASHIDRQGVEGEG